MTKANVEYSDLLKWDDYLGRSPQETAGEMFDHATRVAERTMTWYWKSIKSKKRASLTIRFMIFSLVLCGAVLPILAGILSVAETRLQFTQVGVTALALAGLLEAADRIFGWSSGWLRYIATVMAMENITRKFKLDWGNYMLMKTGSLSDSDKKPLFDIARQFEDDISQKQSEETEKWVTEFNSSTALLSELIKTQREAAEKIHSEEKERQKQFQPGAIELTIKHRSNPVPVKISVDDEAFSDFTGTIWARQGLPPGIHEVCVETNDQPPVMMKKPVNVPAGEIASVELAIV